MKYINGCLQLSPIDLLKQSCQEHNRALLDKALNEDLNPASALEYICQYGHHDFLQVILDQKVEWFNSGVYGACHGGHLGAGQLMIEKGADQFDFGLEGACRGGHMELIQLMIEMLQHNATWSLRSAYDKGLDGPVKGDTWRLPS